MTASSSRIIAETEHSHSRPISRWDNASLAAVVFLFIAVRLWRLATSCIWFDEIFGVHAARHNWAELFRFVAADIIHPPLFYVLLKIWIALGGESLLWLRLLPALFAIASIVPFVLVGRELGLSATSRNFGLLLMAVSGYLIKYAQEVRMYSLLMLLSLWSLWWFIKVFKHERPLKKSLFWLFLINLALVYSHYAGWLIVVLEGVVLLTWQRRIIKEFSICTLLLILSYVPWIYLILSNNNLGNGLKQNIGWMTRPGLPAIVELYSLLNKPFWFVQSTAAQPHDLLTAVVALLIFGIPVIFLLPRIWQPAEQDQVAKLLRVILIFALAPVIIAFVLSWLLPQSIWGTRHLIVIAAPYAILAATAITELPRLWLRTSCYAIAGAWFVLAALTWGFSPRPVYTWCAWEVLTNEALANQQQPKPALHVYAFEDLTAYHLWYSLSSLANNSSIVAVVRNAGGVQGDPAYFLPRRFNDIATMDVSQIGGEDIWVAYRDTAFDETGPPLSKLKNLGYEVVEKYSLALQGQQSYMLRMRRKA